MVNYCILCLSLQQQAQKHTGLGGNMNTLTRFINPVFENNLDETKYEIIENESIKSNVLEGLSISGSLHLPTLPSSLVCSSLQELKIAHL